MKNKIYVLFGPGGSGKDVIGSGFSKMHPNDFYYPIQYSTSPERDDDNPNRVRRGISVDDFLNEDGKGNTLAVERYVQETDTNTILVYYWFNKNDINDALNKSNVFIYGVSLNVYREILRVFGKRNVVGFLLWATPYTRIYRMLNRLDEVTDDDVYQAANRILLDKEQYNKKALYNIGVSDVDTRRCSIYTIHILINDQYSPIDDKISGCLKLLEAFTK